MNLTNGTFTATIDAKMVTIKNDDQILTECGPWESDEAGAAWAQLIIDDLANGIDHYGN